MFLFNDKITRLIYVTGIVQSLTYDRALLAPKSLK